MTQAIHITGRLKLVPGLHLFSVKSPLRRAYGYFLRHFDIRKSHDHVTSTRIIMSYWHINVIMLSHGDGRKRKYYACWLYYGAEMLAQLMRHARSTIRPPR